MRYKIHFGKKSFITNEWLYDYFNSVKEKPILYKRLYNILTGIKTKI